MKAGTFVPFLQLYYRHIHHNNEPPNLNKPKKINHCSTNARKLRHNQTENRSGDSQFSRPREGIFSRINLSIYLKAKLKMGAAAYSQRSLLPGKKIEIFLLFPGEKNRGKLLERRDFPESEKMENPIGEVWRIRKFFVFVFL